MCRGNHRSLVEIEGDLLPYRLAVHREGLWGVYFSTAKKSTPFHGKVIYKHGEWVRDLHPRLRAWVTRISILVYDHGSWISILVYEHGVVGSIYRSISQRRKIALTPYIDSPPLYTTKARACLRCLRGCLRVNIV